MSSNLADRPGFGTSGTVLVRSCEGCTVELFIVTVPDECPVDRIRHGETLLHWCG